MKLSSRRLPISLMACLAVLAGGCARKAPEGPKQTKITVSKETTRLVEPLDAAGYVDYLAAMNRELGRGVTVENNAMILIIEALGPGELPEELRRKYFAALGIPPPGAGGDRLVAWYDYLRDSGVGGRKLGDDLEQLDAAMRGPWSQKELPELAAWLEANRRPLGLLAAAADRPRYYSPRVAGDGCGVASAWFLSPVGCREAGRALVARAMLNLGQEKPEPAWADLMACRRLARLVSQGPTMTERFVGNLLDRMASLGGGALAHHAPATKQQFSERREQLQRLPPLGRMAEALDTAERYLYLDAVAMLCRGDSRLLAEQPRKSREALQAWAGVSADWDEVLRIGNTWYDRMVAIARMSDGPGRLAAARAVERDIAQEIREGLGWRSRLQSFFAEARRTRLTKAVARTLMGVCLPAESALMVSEQGAEAAFRQMQIALELAAYRVEHGRYPEALDQLLPESFSGKKVPVDPFSGQPFGYQRQSRGYRLSSVGLNGTDDGGRSGGDDLVLQMPAPRARAKL